MNDNHERDTLTDFLVCFGIDVDSNDVREDLDWDGINQKEGLGVD